ncbi:MAG: hypothetical protein CBB97_12230 [Candidatus Endolissoclinum sp. TMED37]|jgi:hypothetical protein|nr:MAG: hypothetical protein CBB97_12230 [Candidatus Endolissoclinum sp. TMED37]
MALTPTSKIQAVNIMLASIGEAPVSSLDDATLADVSIAESILDETNVEIQSRGLHCNTEINYPLTPNTDGEIDLPVNCVSVDTTGQSVTTDVVQRGTRLYDRGERSFTTFSGTLFVTMVLLLEFTDLPQHVRRYITVKSARRFQNRILGSQTLSGFTQADENEALLYFEQIEAQTQDYNVLNDNFTTRKIVNRGVLRRALR